jgi:hypothetical protein
VLYFLPILEIAACQSNVIQLLRQHKLSVLIKYCESKTVVKIEIMNSIFVFVFVFVAFSSITTNAFQYQHRGKRESGVFKVKIGQLRDFIKLINAITSGQIIDDRNKPMMNDNIYIYRIPFSIDQPLLTVLT